MAELTGQNAAGLYEENGLFKKREGDQTLLFCWMSPEEAALQECYPSFLKEKLTFPFGPFEHIIHHDEVPPEMKAQGLE